MYLKTTSPQFLKYGSIAEEPSRYLSQRTYFEGKNPTHLDVYDAKVRIEVLEGIAILVLQEEFGSREQFVIHRAPILNKNTPFTVIPLTQSAVIEVSVQSKKAVKQSRIEFEDELNYEPIRPKFSVTDIYSYYYNVKGKDYYFHGESHYNWELTYVDTGELVTEIDGQEYTLSSQQMMLYFPGQFHKQYVIGEKTASYLTIMFDMNIRSADVQHMKNKVFDCTTELYQLTDKFIRHSTIMEEQNVPYARDLMVSYLQEIIIHLIQYDSPKNDQHSLSNPIQANFENELMNEINNYIQRNIFEPISVEDICDQFSISRSTLQGLFKKNLNMPPKQYINELKMSKAQHMILEEKYPITEIALKLGFSSIHYFSRKFKKRYGLAPSEFSQSIYKDTNADI
ncbi:AraC family transcriptional regulator [Erysipelothrix sp. HDW6C]|uniref:AraC family transcriptional regulator n=1 Tax=Erysipelothrix sp. HDW6C TaxID=2714930 RepID=UPI001407C837|nr:helix-turn-helix domain-containing protein [Erysipelothrix sp. HDW6C]QIK69249.1 AraC family transcriptional regulator [Erysipelothrix sp. HDW6C]